MPKVLKLVQSCGDCPHCDYYSGGQFKCKLTGEVVVDKAIIAPFCPLADYPSQMLASMDATIRVLRDSRQYMFATAVLSHLATRLNTVLGPNGVVAIALKNGETLNVPPDHVTEVTMNPFCSVHFLSGGKTFKLYPDTNPPELSEKVDEVEINGVKEPLWRSCELAQT